MVHLYQPFTVTLKILRKTFWLIRWRRKIGPILFSPWNVFLVFWLVKGFSNLLKSAFTKMYLDKRKREVGFLSSHIRQILLLSLSLFLPLSLSFFLSLPFFLSSRFLSILGCFSYIFLFKSLSPCISLPLSFVFFLNICLFPSIIL